MDRISEPRIVRHNKNPRRGQRRYDLRPMIRLVGSKGRVRQRLISLMPPHQAYAEPFVGTGTVLLGKQPVRVEMVNDLNGEIANLLVVLRDQAQDLSRMLSRTPASQRIYDNLYRQDATSLDPVQRAFRYTYINRNCFVGAAGSRSSFVMSAKNPRSYDAKSLGRLAILLQKRLSRVQIYEMDCIEFIDRVDHKDAFFLIDPPYPGCEKYYAAPFSSELQARLAERLSSLKGKAMVTLPDTRIVRSLYGHAHDFEPIDVAYSAARKSRTIAKELVIAIGYTFDKATG